MFDPQSRYANLDQVTLEVTAADGTARQIKYVRRRFIQAPRSVTTLVEHTVTADERLDNLTSRYLGDPTQFWRLCDTNAALRPTDLTDEVGRIIRIGFSIT
ncbi:MAG: LysM domain-containing protein [Deltaproteobacteria bacterium]